MNVETYWYAGLQVSQELLQAGEGVQGMASHMALSLSSSLVKAGVGEPGWFQLLAKEVLVPLVMFGAVFRKQHRVVRDTLLFVRSCGDRYTCTTHRLLGASHCPALPADSEA